MAVSRKGQDNNNYVTSNYVTSGPEPAVLVAQSMAVTRVRQGRVFYGAGDGPLATESGAVTSMI